MIMRKIINISFMAFIVVFSAVSCHGIEPDVDDEVHLSASIPYLTTITKGSPTSDSGIKNVDTDEVLEIALARIDQNLDVQYPAFVNAGNVLYADMKKPNSTYMRDIEFTNEAQYFRNNSDAIKYAAWYPQEDFTTGPDSTYITFDIDGQTDVMYSNVSTGTKNESFNTMYFSHALCVYRVYVYAMLYEDEDGNQTNMADKWGKLQTMQLKNLPNQCILRLPLSDGKTFHVSYPGTTNTIDISDASNNIFFDPGDALPLGIANKRYVAKVVAAPPSSGVLDIALTTENASASQNVSIARNFKAGCAYDIILRFSDHGFINADVSVSQWNKFDEDVDVEAGVDMFYNLSTYGTANSYMITSGNYGYSFIGNVMGNGNGTPVGVSNTTINPGYIDILWSDMPDVSLDITRDKVNNPVDMQTVQLVSNELSEGKVLFKVYGNQADTTNRELLAEGNVIIAAYDNQTDKNILWTWHLWLCDKVKNQGYTNGYTVQDRNLGAIANSPTGSDYSAMEGLYYQWGRFSPLKGSSFTTSTATATVSEAVAHPTTFYGKDASDWLSSGNTYADHLWGWTTDYTDPVKTIYDPCPLNYMIADYRMWRNMADFQIESAYTANLGVNLSIASNNIWYPFNGAILSNGSISKSPHQLYMWSNSISEDDKPYYFIYDSANSSKVTSDGKRNVAAPVRCVYNRGVSVVKNLSASQTANCYMVHKDGYYKFDVTVRGNGVGVLWPLGGTYAANIKGDLSSVNISPAKVDVLWWQGDLATGNTTPATEMCIDILDGGVPDSDGYVTFLVDNFYKGNAILAAYDASNNILWTWHIWLTDKPADVATGQYSLMDRFLGATFAPAITSSIAFSSSAQRLSTYGFYYQWGRKDPIPGPPDYNSGTRSDSNSSKWWKWNGSTWTGVTAVTTADAATIATVTAAPMAFYKGTTAAGANTTGWYNSDFIDGYTNVAMWGYAVADYNAQGQNFSKTMHDPCPPGYRTPFHYAWDGVVDGAGYSYIPSGEAQGNVTFSNGESGYASNGIVLNQTNFSKAWYPFTGYRNPINGYCTSVGSQGRMFTGMPMTDYNTRYYNYNSTQTGQRGAGECGAGYGFAIRCQKD
jgi:hypothetical protein